MLVMPVDVDPSGPLCLLVIGLTAEDCAKSAMNDSGVLPMIDIMEILYRLNFPKPVGAVQVIYGESNEAIEAQLAEALPGHDVIACGDTLDDPAEQNARNQAMQEERRAGLVARTGDRDDKAAAQAVRTNNPGWN